MCFADVPVCLWSNHKHDQLQDPPPLRILGTSPDESMYIPLLARSQWEVVGNTDVGRIDTHPTVDSGAKRR